MSKVSNALSSPQMQTVLRPLVDIVKDVTPRMWVTMGVAALYMLYRQYSKRYVPPNTVLELDLRNVQFQESAASKGGLMSLMPETGIHVQTLIRTLAKAAKDPRIAGLVVTLDTIHANLVDIQEMREAVLSFRASGKKTLLHANTFKELGSGTILYWFASAFEEIYMPVIGSLHLSGLKANVPFLHSLFTKIGSEPLITARRKYKNAANMFMEEKFTKEHKEVTEYLVKAIYEEIVNDIAAARGLSVDTVRQLLADGPYSSEKAVELKLINGTAYEDEFYDSILNQRFKYDKNIIRRFFESIYTTISQSTLQPKINLLFASHFYTRIGGSPYNTGKHKIAVINVIGSIHMGESILEWDGREVSAGADTIVLGFRQAIADKKVKAILLRVVSGGGSAVASDMIAQQVTAAKAAGKKVVVSMGQLAASGGYYVSCYADKIVASPITITGSIGVVAGKVNMKGTWNKLGVTFDSVETAENGGFYDMLSPYEGANRDKLEGWVDDLYEKFKGHVAAGRKMTDEQVEALAQGRVWMGNTAMQNGLVDVLGGFETAIKVLKTEMGLADADTLRLVKFPLPTGMMDALMPQKNTRELPKRSVAFSFLPQVVYSISSLAHMWKTLYAISQRQDVRALVNASMHCDISNLPNELSVHPAFVSMDAPNLTI